MTTRKVFLAQLAGGGLGLLLGGCGGGGGDESNPPPAAPPSACGSTFTMTGHAGHALTIPAADLDSTTAKTYSIQGAAAHDHQITLSPAQLADLKAGRGVTVTSTETMGLLGLHTHDVAGRCA